MKTVNTSLARERTPPLDDPERARDFRELFEAELGFVYRALRRQGVRERDLADACQETFLVVHRRLPEFEGRSSLRTWIYGIAVRVAAAQRRKAHVVRELLAEEPAESSAPPLQLDSAAHSQLLATVESALSATHEDRREVFVLYELEGLTMREVAEALQISENTAFSRLYAARTDVRAFVERRGHRAPSKAGVGK